MRMTVEELAALPGVAVGTKEAAAVLGCDRYSLNIAAKQKTLNLDYFYAGNRLKISKASLLRFCGVLNGETATPKMIFTRSAIAYGGDRE